jgi:hypothetical protein
MLMALGAKDTPVGNPLMLLPSKVLIVQFLALSSNLTQSSLATRKCVFLLFSDGVGSSAATLFDSLTFSRPGR